MKEIAIKAGAVAAVVIVAVFLQMPSKPEAVNTKPRPAIEQTGYFKSDERDRIMAFHSDQPLSEVEARALFEQQTKTQGRAFRAVAYSGKDNPGPADALTLAGSFQRALEVTVTPPHDDWDWMYIVNPAGNVTLKRGDGKAKG